jgi:uracil-DNA glycosylase
MTKKNTTTARASKQAQLDALYAPHQDFKNSPLYVPNVCTKIVFGEGNPDATILFIGEAPGRDEDEQGRPFVGRSGKLLNRALFLVGLQREDVYITNIVKCRPPGNRTPFPEELKTGKEQLLLKQIEIIDPVVICTLGAAALCGLTEQPYKITAIRGQPIDFDGRILLPTYHPAYVLRNQAVAQTFLSDIKKVAILGKGS